MKIDKILEIHEKFGEFINNQDELTELLELPINVIEKLETVKEKETFELVLEAVFDNNNFFSNAELIKLIEIIGNAKSKAHAEYVINIINDEDAIQIKNILKLASIVANAVSEENVQVAADVAVDKEVLESEYSLELTKLIANKNTSYDILEYARQAATDTDVLAESGHVKEIVSAILNCKNEVFAHNATTVATNMSAMLPCANQLTKLVANAKTEYASERAKYTALNKNIIYHQTDNIVELVKLVASGCKEYNLYQVYEFINNSDNKDFAQLLEFAKAIASTKTKEIADVVLKAANNHLVRNHPNGINILKMIAKCKYNYLAEDTLCVLEAKINPLLTERKALLEDIIRAIINSKSLQDSKNICTLTIEYPGYSTEDFKKLIDIISNTKDVNYSSNVYEVFSNPLVIETNYAPSLVESVANAKGEYQCRFAARVATNKALVESGHVVELTHIIANCKNHTVARLIYDLLDDKDKKISISDIVSVGNILFNCTNDTNHEAVFSLVVTGEYKKSKDPLESIKKIINSKSEYVCFTDAYNDSPEIAINGLNEIKNEFPDIDMKLGDYYIKFKTPKKSK